MAAGRCHAPIERLTDLAHYKELVRGISAQGRKNGVPVRRQGNPLGSDQFGHESPRINSLNGAITISAGGNSLLCSLAFQLSLILLGHTFVGNDSVKRKILRSEQERESWS
jgi:hypothetical protein